MCRRRWLVAGTSLALYLVFAVGGGHRGQHVARNLLVPGAGLYGEAPLWGVTLTVAAMLATIAWLRWGMDWTVVAVVGIAMVVTSRQTGGAHAVGAAAASQSAHEFPLVVLIAAWGGWMRAVLRRAPVVSAWQRRRWRGRAPIALMALEPVERCRAVALSALAGTTASHRAHEIRAALDAPDITRRARRVALVARGRFGGDPLRVDHAHARAALALSDQLSADGAHRLATDAGRSWAGVPASEPGWVRLLDGTLCAIALRSEHPHTALRWGDRLNGTLNLQRGHRPGRVWTPLALPAGRADDWEHATASALAHACGWLDDRDWAVLRARCLGASARGAARPEDERLIAAGRLWAVLTADGEATTLLARPTIGNDPLAVAIDDLARVLRSPHRPLWASPSTLNDNNICSEGGT